jgi:hypothetical protein
MNSREAITQRHADGAERNVHAILGKLAKDSIFAKDNRFQCRVVGHHGKDDATLASFRYGLRRNSTIRTQRFSALASAIVDSEMVTGAKEALRDTSAHIAQADQTCIHCVFSTF